MKALTISQPYASLIANGQKVCENRTWTTTHRGPLAIHAGQGSRYLSRDELRKHVRSAIVAKCELQHVFHIDDLRKMPASRVLMNDGERNWSVADILSHEHTEGPYCWLLNRVVKLDTPIPGGGALGLWEAGNI